MTTKAKQNRHMPVSKATNAYELLDEIRKLILEEPKRYDQTDTLRELWEGDPEMGWPICGTVGCVAGWTVVLRGDSEDGVWEQARVILGLSVKHATSLFRDSAAGNSEPQTEGHATRGAAHIKRFMEKHAAQLKAKAV